MPGLRLRDGYNIVAMATRIDRAPPTILAWAFGHVNVINMNSFHSMSKLRT